jgi:hypothetical protein
MNIVNRKMERKCQENAIWQNFMLIRVKYKDIPRKCHGSPRVHIEKSQYLFQNQISRDFT